MWSTPPSFTPAERALLAPAARLVIAIESPQGADQPVTLATAVLATLAAGTPEAREFETRLDELVRWTDEAGATAESASFKRVPGAIDSLEAALADWPAPAIVERLDALYLARQKQFASALHNPVAGGPDSARRALGELLLAHGDEMQRAALNIATLYLRSGSIERAAKHTAVLAGDAGDDPDLRGLLDAAAKPTATAADFLALARRFLPRVEQLGGTSTDTADPVAAFRVLEAGLARAPRDVDLLHPHGGRRARRLVVLPRDPPPRGGRRHPRQDARDAGPAGARLGRAAWSSTSCACACAWTPSAMRRLRRGRRRAPPVRRGPRALPDDRHQASRRRHRLRGRPQLRQHGPDRARRRRVLARARGGRARRPRSPTELAELVLKRGEPRRAATSLRDGLETCAARPTSQPARDDRRGRGSGAPGAAARRRARRRGRARRRRCRVARGARRLGAPDDGAPAPQEVRRLGRGDLRGRAHPLSARPPRRGHPEVRRGARAGQRPRPDLHRRRLVPGPERRDRRRRLDLPPRAGAAVERRVRVRQGVLGAVDPRPEAAGEPESHLRTPSQKRTCARSTSATASCARAAAPPGTTCSRASRRAA